jgi:hypothetical protein
MNLRQDEIAAGHDLYMALVRADYAPYPWRAFTDLLVFSRNVFESRTTADLYRNDPEGFREWYDYVGSEHERESSESELKEALDGYGRFGRADKWDWEISNFRAALTDYWGDEHYIESFMSALQEALQVLCFPIFTEELANPLLERWPSFSDKFQPLVYSPRTLEELHLKNMEDGEIFY